MIKKVFITGANAGLGKETARQLAQQPEIDTIYLGCRNLDKAKAARDDLIAQTGRHIFEVIPIDVSDLASVKHAVQTLPQAVDALVMNAGGTGGKHFYEKTATGVTQIVAVNLLGHVLLTQELLAQNKLTQVALYAGSEAARGVPEMGMKRPALTQSSVDEFIALCKGELFASQTDATVPYGPIKYMAALWMASMARDYPKVRFLTMSPGATTGTEGFNSLSPLKRVVMKSMMQLMLFLGKVHKVDVGAQRFVDGLLNDSYPSGAFYASAKGLTGPLDDQSRIFADIGNQTIQDNAKATLLGFIH